MRLFGRLFRPVCPRLGDGEANSRYRFSARRAVVEWQDSDGAQLSQNALIQTDGDGKPRILVRKPFSLGLARIRESAWVYSVEVVSITPRRGQLFELKLNYLGEGRRRENRMRAGGSASLEGESLPTMTVQVVDVSNGGIQLFSTRPVSPGTSVRVSGKKSKHVGIVRHCRETPGGYRLGVQIVGEYRRYQGA